VRVRPLSALSGDLMALAARLQTLQSATARELLPPSTLEHVRQSNAEIWATKGRAIGRPWGSYQQDHPGHPLPKPKGATYWLIDFDYFEPDHLRSSLTQLGRTRNSVVTWRQNTVGWRSIVPYADRVNARFGTIYGLTPKARAAIFEGMRRRLFKRIVGPQ